MGQFFIHRPVFAIVVSLVILIAGGLAMLGLPISLYPQITPPTIEVEINYPGASAEVVEQSIASAVEQEINGAENMIYYSSKCSSDGRYLLNCTFSVGTNIDLANVDVNNRVNKASPKLPAEAIAYGISVKKKSPDLLQVVTVSSPERTFDELFLSNYAKLNVNDLIARAPGVGSTMVVGLGDYSMRLWLRPDRLTALGLTATDISQVVKEQNVLAPAGAIGQPPAKPGQEFQFTVDVKGRLVEAAEFENMVVRTRSDGSILRIRDVARSELGAKTYTSFGRFDDVPATLILVYQLPGANAIETAKAVETRIDEIRAQAPPGISVDIPFDFTRFIEASIEEVEHTFVEALVLVLLVVFIFIGNFRATLVPMLAVPVSLVGTFALFGPMGFSINTLTLFGLVLAIGIVVDDAIVVVEAVEHHIEHGKSPVEATELAMKEVGGALIAIALVLCAVFVPVAFMGGISGQLYKQFALTIAISVVLSAIVALSLTPALCAMLLRPRREMRGPLGWFLAGFNRVFGVATTGYTGVVRLLCRRVLLGFVALAAFYAGAGGLMKALPGGFVPDEDQGYYYVAVTLPDGASLERNDALLHRVEEGLRKQPGVRSLLTLGGLNLIYGTYSSNTSSIIVLLEDWSARETADTSIAAIMGRTQRELAQYPEAVAMVFLPPPIPGLGAAGGFQFELQDRASRSPQELADLAADFAQQARQRPEIGGVFSSFRTNVPQVRLDVDRDKVRTLGVPIDAVFQSLQIYLGGLQVNDFNRFGRTYKVVLQAEPEFRASVENIDEIYVRGGDDEMVPLSTVVTVRDKTGADVIFRYNMSRCSDLNGAPAPGYSSSQAIAAMSELGDALPKGYGYEWTGTAYQEQQAGGTQALILVLGIIFVFLFLAAQYESWGIPFSVLLGIPLGVFGAFLGIFLRGLVNDTYAQIGLVMLVGLAAKNAILIVEFAKMKYDGGMALRDAAVEAAKLRFRPILMTSFAFILGVVPLVLASGAGAASRWSLGTAVFSGMTAATCLGVFFIPFLYVVVQGFTDKVFGKRKQEAPAPAHEPEAHGGTA